MGDKHHRYYKQTKIREVNLQFLVDLIWNDPQMFDLRRIGFNVELFTENSTYYTAIT